MPTSHVPAPDLILTGGTVHTVDRTRPRAEAVAVTGGRITMLGSAAEVSAVAASSTEVVDLCGRLLLPGFVDAHNHVRLGSDEDSAQLAGADSLAEVHRRIAAWAAAHPGADWIEAEAFDYGAIPGGRMPTAADLDVVTGDRPAFVLTYDVHSVWLNTAALRRLGVTRDTERLPFGVVEKDPATGEPTGFLTGFAVLGLARDGQRALAEFLPWAGDSRRYHRLCRSLDMAAENGLTTVVEPQNSLDDLPLFERARGEGRLRSRLIAALFHGRGTTAAELDEFAAAAKKFDDDQFRVGPLKLYIDDVVEPHTAALLEPYANEPGNSGRTFYDPEEFAAVLTELDRRGFQTFTHATGDRGIRVALDAHEAARRANGPRDARHQLVHVECLHPGDVDRFARLGVVACMQPRHGAPDVAGPGKDWAEGVGQDRWAHAWAFRSLRDAGTTLAFSSDWNVAEMDPLAHLYTAVTRRDRDGGRAWVPEQAITLQEAVEAYTLGSAYANFCENDRGSVTVGKYADFAVVSQDVFAAPAEALRDAAIDLTVLGGEIVYAR
ncbi:amidohydrolase [Streptomyces sp. NPDC048211]|uniref:amidohydrolase n=1 Tax=Streptomyces sp. NPDC048211 TaxID=3365516 RepID=UPI00371D02B7